MQTKIIAHRGDTRNHPENTLSAFKAALDSGADAIELDVHLTRDGEIIVHHNYYLGHPDNGEGNIYERDLAYIRSLTIGAERIPTLEEVFELIGNSLQYEIELKGCSEELLTKVAALVKKHDLESVIEFTSPHAYNLTRIKSLGSLAQTGMFIAPLPDWMDKKLGQMLVINNALLGDIDVLHCPLALIDVDFVRTAHGKGLLVHAADCDLRDDLRTAFDMGVDQISTNEIGAALSVREGI